MKRLLIAPITVLALAATGCSFGGDSSSDDSGKTVVTFRLWDEQVAKAYEESFAAFEKENTDIDVKVELVPWDNYWTKLPTDISSDTAPDIYWMNSANYGVPADQGNLEPLDSHLGKNGFDTANWTQSVVDLYTRDGKLYGVPQLWDSIALYYNKSLVDAAGIDPATLKWDPSGTGDTFLPAAQKLTLDAAGVAADQPTFDPSKVEQFGFNAYYDLQAIWLDFLASNGGSLQQADGDDFQIDTPEGVAAFQYVVDLINKYHVSPSAADTNDNGEKALQLFTQGKIALFQSGPYHLKAIQEGASFEWGIVPMLEGPQGRVSVVHGVSAVLNSKSKNLDAAWKVIEWLGTDDGQRPIAEGGFAFPGAKGVQQAYVDYWKEQDIDLQPFVEAANGDTTRAPFGPRVQAGLTAMEPILKEMFLGRKPVADALAEAQAAGNEAQKE